MRRAARALSTLRLPSTPGVEAALTIAGVSMLLLGLGGWLWWWRSGFGDLQGVFVKSALFGSAMSFGLWLAWLLVAYALLQAISGATVPMDRLVREAGVATAPLALGVLMVLPVISFAIGLAVIGAWAFATQSAIERASGQRGLPVLIANAAGFALWATVLSLLATGSHPLAPGPFLAESVWEAVVRHAPTITN